MKWILLVLFSFSVFAKFEAKIVKSHGVVKVDGKKAKKNQLVEKGQVISALGKKNFFIVKYSTGTSFLIRDGELLVEAVQPKATTFQLLNGTIHSYVNKKTDKNVTIKTKRASFGVRGTKFWLRESVSESYLCVCEGKVEVENDKGKISVERNQDLHVRTGEELQTTAPTDFMWSMATEGLKEMGIDVEPRS